MTPFSLLVLGSHPNYMAEEVQKYESQGGVYESAFKTL